MADKLTSIEQENILLKKKIVELEKQIAFLELENDEIKTYYEEIEMGIDCGLISWSY